jgi:chromosome segregation ATPase
MTDTVATPRGGRPNWQAAGVVAAIAVSLLSLAVAWGSMQSELRHLDAAQQAHLDRIERLEEADRRLTEALAAWRSELAELRAELRALRDHLPRREAR